MTTPTSGKDELREKILSVVADAVADGIDQYDDLSTFTPLLVNTATDEIMQLTATSNQQAFTKGYSTGVIDAHLDCAEDKRQAVQKALTEKLTEMRDQWAVWLMEPDDVDECKISDVVANFNNRIAELASTEWNMTRP